MQIVPGRGSRRDAGGRPRRRAQSFLFALTFVALGIGSIAGVTVARHRAEESADTRAERAAVAAADALSAEIERLRLGIAGSSALVRSDGTLDVEAFEAFAEDLTSGAGVLSLVLVGASDGDYRTISMVPARPGAPPIDADADRLGALRQAEQERRTVLTQPLQMVSLPRRGVQVVRPIIHREDPSNPVVGFVVAPLTLDRIGSIVRDSAGPTREISVVAGDTPIVGDEIRADAERFTAPVTDAGQGWSVVLAGGDDPDLTVAWLVAAGGLVAIAAMGALAVTTGRHQRRLARANDLLTVSEARTRAVQEVAGRLARALTAREIVTALVEHLPAAVGASSAAIAVNSDSGKLEVLGLEEPVEGASDVPLPGADDPDSHVRSVLAGGQAVWLRSPLDWRGDQATGVLAGGGSALALLPLSGDDVSGLLAVAYPRVRIFGAEEQALLHTVSILAARALARGRRYDAEHRAAVAFQRAALPDDLPSVAGLSIAARYRPATRQATVGGDWYDVLVLDERRVVLVVGDVVGHGMVAAAAMGRLRTAFQAIARLSADPGAMVAALSNQVESIPDSFCTTVVCAVADLGTGELSWCRAGHTPPLLLRDGDGPELLDEPCLPPLGVALDPPHVVHTRWLRTGDRVVLYTDGVVERREESIDDGFRRLAVAAEALGDLDPEEFSDALVEALVPGDQADDLAVLVVRYDATPSVTLASAPPEEPIRITEVSEGVRRVEPLPP